jgi:hypothetical protein
LRSWLAEGVAAFAATVEAKASEVEAVEGVAALVAVDAAAAAIGRLPVTVVVKAAAGIGRIARDRCGSRWKSNFGIP